MSVLLLEGDRARAGRLLAALESSEVTRFRVLSVCTSLTQALDELRRRPVDVVLLDLEHPRARGLEALVALRDASPTTAVVVLAEDAANPELPTALRLGAADYLLPDELQAGVVARVTRYAALRKEADEREHRIATRYRQLFLHSMDAVLVTDPDGHPLEANDAALDLLDVDRSTLEGSTLHEFLPNEEERERLRCALEAGRPVAGMEVRIRTGDGRERTCLLSAAAHAGEGEEASFHHAIFHDITGRKEAEERLARAALHDPLTGLPNRTLLSDRLDRAHARARRDPREHPYALLFLDLDRFKRINDRFGHPGGDRVLVHVGRTLVATVRESDTVARIGGDEFAVLLPGSGVDEACEVAGRILEDLARPFALDGATLGLTASIGVAVPAAEGADPAALLRDADTAMYRAKATGRGRWQIFDPAMREETVQALTLESELRAAVRESGLRLLFQPIHGAREGELRGFEALLRWQHPERGLLPAAAFIPLAEESGLIVDVGEWVIREACKHLSRWHDALEDTYLSVNVSPKQFMQPDLVQRIARILEETGAPPHRLKLELTESALMRDADRTVQMLHELRDLGLELWIDDFGTGHSSLAHLQRFPVAAVKIERGFVSRLGAETVDESAEEVVRLIISLARTLGLDTVAEGVETAGQLDRVRSLGATELQGFLLCRPVPGHQAAGVARRGPPDLPGAWKRGEGSRSRGRSPRRSRARAAHRRSGPPN